VRKKTKNRDFIRPILFWSAFIVLVINISPESILAFFAFYLLLTLALIYTLQNLFSAKRSIIWSSVFVFYLLLRQLNLANIINTIILVGILISLDIYLKS